MSKDRSEQSPKGDLGIKDDKEMAKFFPRKIKNYGKEDQSSHRLPFRKPATAIDPQFGPGDKVS